MLAIETGWPPPELFVTVSITRGTRFGPTRSMSCSRRAVSILPLKGCMRAGSSASGMGRSTASAPTNSQLARVVSKWVLFGTTEDGLHRIAETRKTGRASVGLVAAHHRRPLLGGHRVGAGVREQIDQDGFRGDEKQVVAGGFEQPLALLAGRAPDGLDALDAKWFDDGLNQHGDLAAEITDKHS